MSIIRVNVPVFGIQNADGLQYLWSNGKAITFFVRGMAEQWLREQQERGLGIMDELTVTDRGEISVELDVGQLPSPVGCGECIFEGRERTGRIATLCPECSARAVGKAFTIDNVLS